MKIQQQRRPQTNQAGSAPAVERIPIQTRPFIAESSLRQLQQLYGNGATTSNEQPVAVVAAAVGTLPASSMDAVVAQMNKMRFGNSVVPKLGAATAKRHEAAVMADLMDVDLS